MLENKDIDKMGNLKGEKGIAELKEWDRGLNQKEERHEEDRLNFRQIRNKFEF